MNELFFYSLIDELLESPDPYALGRGLLIPILGDIEALRTELLAFADDLVILGRVEGCPPPEAAVEEIRADLERMRDEPTALGLLFSDETRGRCGHTAVPLLAAAILMASNWVEFASEWLDATERLRIRADALLCRLPGSRWIDRRGSGPRADTAEHSPPCALVVE